MRRREVIALLGGAWLPVGAFGQAAFVASLSGAAAWPGIAGAQHQQIPRLCFLTLDPGTLRTRWSHRLCPHGGPPLRAGYTSAKVLLRAFEMPDKDYRWWLSDDGWRTRNDALFVRP